MSKEIEAFKWIICSYSKEILVNVVQSKILKMVGEEDNDLTKKSKVDLSHLSPRQDALLPYIYRLTIE